jgi:hypothetical protein
MLELNVRASLGDDYPAQRVQRSQEFGAGETWRSRHGPAPSSHLSRVEQFKRFTILPTEWSPESEELTPTMKLRRRVVENKYRPQIEAMYADPPGGHSVDAQREAART